MPAARRFFSPPGVCVGILAALLGFRFFRFIDLYAVNIPYWDQWDFLSDFFPGGHPTLVHLFLYQHGPHREGLGLIADRFLYAATAWNIRAESFLIGACIFAAMLLALVLKRKLSGRFTWTDAAIPLIFLTLVQCETLIGTPNPAYAAFPLLLLMLYSLALLQPAYLSRYSLMLVINFILIFTGFGLFMGIVTPGVFLLEAYWSRRGWSPVPLRAPVAGFLLACASGAVFLIGYHFLPAADCFAPPHAPYAPYAEFAAILFANFAGLWILGVFAPGAPLPLQHLAGTVPLLLAGLVFALLLYRLLRADTLYDVRRRSLIAAALIAFSGLFALNTAAGRLCLGLVGAFTSRYTSLLIPAFLGIYLFIESWRVPAAARWAALLLLGALVVPGSVLTPPTFHFYVDGKRNWMSCYLERESVAECDVITHFQIYPVPERTHLQSKLAYLKQQRLSLFSGAMAPGSGLPLEHPVPQRPQAH